MFMPAGTWPGVAVVAGYLLFSAAYISKLLAQVRKSLTYLVFCAMLRERMKAGSAMIMMSARMATMIISSTSVNAERVDFFMIRNECYNASLYVAFSAPFPAGF